ncbi:hypothetical protein [Bacteroides ndongoniae]|uniref:hypothetical protein n=1 Tax=Bacteroides ndongoniae TaxID=1903262 RepID=UPI0023F9D326|nr:hypothetical protein [Bacteroides ndongoniae]
MKTKFLFSAALVTTMLAACTNEDFVESSKVNVVNDGRPVAGKVVLDFGDASTRMDYNSETDKFTWDGSETIAALLMDEVDGTSNNYRPYNNPEEWANLTWYQKYKLVNYINTNYPFTWDEERGAWTTPAKMLEGNYFFAYPRETYNGERQLIHSLANQVQEGSSKEAMEKAYARNQYWIGYSQIKAGAENEEVLASVKMARTLSPIKFKITTVSTQTEYTVEKVTIQGDDLKTLLTIDPTKAGYNGKAAPKANDQNGIYNLKDGSNLSASTTVFNYANFIEAKDDLYNNANSATAENTVYNIEEGNESNYSWGDAIRATVQAGNQLSADKEYAELYIKDATPISGQNQKAVWGVVFVNLDEQVASGELTMSIYTDKGIVKDIDLTKVNDGSGSKYAVITDHAITSLTSTGNAKEITIQIDDNSFDIPQEMTVNNVDDLERFITWNSTKNRVNTVTLANNDTLTADMANTLIASQNAIATSENRLKVKAESNQKLFIEAGVNSDIFNYIDVKGVDVVVLGELNLNEEKLKENTGLPESTKGITVAEGGKLNIEAWSEEALSVDNYGTLEVKGETSNIKVVNKKNAELNVNSTLTVNAYSKNEIEGTVNVNVNGILRGTTSKNFTNNGTLVNNGEIYNMINDGEDAVIKTSQKINHIEENNNNATILKTNIGDPISGINLSAGDKGVVKYVSTTNVDMSKVISNYITALEINGADLRVEGGASVLKKLEIKNGRIEGGSYIASVWTPSSKLLNMADGAKVEMSGEMELNWVTIKATAGVEVLDGVVTMTNKVQIADDGSSTNKYPLTLGSIDGYKKYSVTIRNSGNVVVGALNTVAGTPKSTIYNNGTFKYSSSGSDLSNINVNGTELVQE